MEKSSIQAISATLGIAFSRGNGGRSERSKLGRDHRPLFMRSLKPLLYKSENGGREWRRLETPHHEPTTFALLPERHGQILIGTYRSGVLSSEDDGGSWRSVGTAGDWRCLAVEKLSRVELRAEAWHTEPRSRRQTCIDEIDFDADAQPEEDPQ
jgi:hypothetical protein